MADAKASVISYLLQLCDRHAAISLAKLAKTEGGQALVTLEEAPQRRLECTRSEYLAGSSGVCKRDDFIFSCKYELVLANYRAAANRMYADLALLALSTF